MLLVPAITYRATDFQVSAANRLGLDVVIGSDGALPLGGQPVVRVDPDDAAASAHKLRAAIGSVNSVVAVDSQMLPLAQARLAARSSGLQHNPVAAVQRPRRTRPCNGGRGRKHGISQPAFHILAADADGEDALRRAPARALGFPCVVKPVSLSGSRGVIRADDSAEVLAAAQVIRGILAEIGSPGEPIVIEEFVPGWELSIDGLLTDGALAVTAIFDKPATCRTDRPSRRRCSSRPPGSPRRGLRGGVPPRGAGRDGTGAALRPADPCGASHRRERGRGKNGHARACRALDRWPVLALAAVCRGQSPGRP